MAGKEHYSYKDFRLQRRISHPFATLVQTIISTSGDEMRASIVQKIMQSDLSEILPSSLKVKFFDSILGDFKNFQSEIFELSLNLHHKLMKSSPKEFAPHCFRNVVNASIALAELHQNKERFEFDDPVLTRLFHLSKFALRIMNYVMINAFLFSENEISDICNDFIKFICHREDHVLSPFTMLCYIDPLSKWSQNIVHSLRTRCLFFNCVEAHPEFLCLLLTIIRDWFHSPSIPKNEKKDAFDHSNVKYPIFMSSFCSAVNICKYEPSCKLFPVVISGKSYDFTFLLLVSFEFFKQSKCMHSAPSDVINFLAKTLGMMFNNAACDERLIFSLMFQDIHLWVSPLIILLSSIMNHEVSTNRFLAALEEKVLNEPKEVQSNLMAKFVCKLIANALNSMVKDGDEELAANMDTIFKGLFLNNYTIHTLMKEDQKLFPHMLHVFYNNAASGTNDMIEVVLRCIQKVLPVIIFSPQCLSLLEENYAVPEMLYFLNLKKIFDESWKSTLFTLTVVLRSSKMFSLQRNVLIKKVLKNFINDVNHEAFIDFEDQKRFLFVFYCLTHETYALIEAMEPLPEQESEAITGECENTPTSLLDFLMSASESRQSGTQVNDTAVKIVRNIMSSLDSYLCLLHNLEMISILREANLYMDQADPKVTLKVNENLAEIYNSAKKEENENEEMANLNELSRMLMDGGGTVQFFSQNVKFEVAEFETILISLPKEDGPIKFKFSELWGDISGEEKDGVRFIIEYGTLLGIFEATQNPAPDLELLQLSTKEAFKMDFLTFSSFNWFFSTIYLLLEADLERTKRCLTLLTRLPVSKFFIQDLPINHWAMLDYMISKELPHLSLNLQNYGISAWVLCRKWTKECFLLILPWSQLKSLLIFVLVHPERYLFYFWVTFLRENQEVILLNLKKGNLMISNDLSYSLRESIDEISELEEKYNYL